MLGKDHMVFSSQIAMVAPRWFLGLPQVAEIDLLKIILHAVTLYAKESLKTVIIEHWQNTSVRFQKFQRISLLSHTFVKSNLSLLGKL